ncbi:MAG: PAS domain S-box protein, partial [Anaerolineae bacterium]
MSIPLRMLVVQEKEDDALRIVNELRRSGYDPEFEQVRTAEAFSAALSEGTWDVIIADYTMPRFDGITALNLLQESERDVPFIVVSGKPSEDEAVAAMKAGAHGYIMRRSLARLGQVVRRELQEAQTRRDRRRAREELRKSEEKYRTLVEQSLQGLIIVQNSRIVFANPAFAEISGYTVDELLSLSPEEVRDLVHREDQPLVWGRLSERLEGEPVPPRYEYRGIRKDGSVRWLEMFADRIEYMGKPAVQGAFMDVTERKWAEERLRFLSSIVEQSTEGVAVADLEGNLIFVNNAFASMHGYTPEELVGKPIAVFHTPEQMRDVETANRQIRETGQFSGEIWHVRRDGTVFPTLMHNSLLRDGVGNPIGLIGTMRNIAERKQAEEALRQYTERLKVLREIDQAILEAQSPQEIAQAALARIRQLLPCDRASVMLFDLKAGEGKMLAVNVSGETRIGPEAHLPLAKFGDIEELREGEARLVRDILAVSQPAPLKQTLHAEERLRSFIEVPLISRGELIGSLNLGAEEPDVCGEEQIEVAREVADQLAVAIQNAQLLEVERRHRAELEALHQASLRLTSTLELQPVLETILEQALYPMSADDAHIFLYDGQRLTFGAALWAEGLQKEPYAEPRLDGLTYTVARRGERVVIPDVDVHPLFQDWGWGGAIVGLPLRVGDKVVGVMNVAFKEPHVFSEDELRILRLLADQAAIAIENARLYEEAKQRAAEMFALHETVLDVTAQLEMPSLLDAIIARASELLGATGGLVHLYNPTSGELVAVTSHNLETDYAGLTLGVGEGAAGSVLETGEPAIVEDHRVWSGKSPQVTKADARSVLAVPLKWREQILGVLDIVDNVRVGAFDEQDLRVLVPFANQAAIAIENARLYQETRRQANKLAALIEIGHDISATLDLPTVLERIATHARDLLEADESEV